ncbi:acyl-CoA thioesterase [Apibacter adventoris]|uniref:acyl-CoA thioesterase n=1 Tax=Apibacter adventoris TaxID=1679466 RepID=UPI000CF6B615|nr:thioesterase family protein [Apibacter adventoris]PQL95099.1 thioesterase [Apibacter adventoris]
MIKVTTKVRVRYSETDQMGYVYYGNYPQYFEVGRVELFRYIGLPYKDIEEYGIMLPVADLSIKYIKPAKYDDELLITTTVKKIPEGARIVFEYEIKNQEDILLTKGYTTLYFMDKNSGKILRCPEQILNIMKPFFE